MDIKKTWLLPPREQPSFMARYGYRKGMAIDMKDRLMNGLNLLLMFNLFFVLFCFGWFAIALVGRSANINLGFDTWYSLWDPVIMPSIGILMAGALVSGISSWVSRKFLKEDA